MYRYIQSQADVLYATLPQTDSRREELSILSNWLQNAAAINANDGSFKSEFVRAASDGYSLAKNGVGISRDRFQEASDGLARDIFTSIIKDQGVSTAQDIIDQDVQSAVNDLGLGDKWGWAGTAGDWFPQWMGGLGKDMVHVGKGENLSPTQLFVEYAKVLFANGYGAGLASGNLCGYAVSQQFHKVSSLVGALSSGSAMPGLLGGVSMVLLAANAASAATVVPRVDPLVLDLDGDGIETTSSRDGRVVLFDHNADGIRTGTGWVRPDDGWLVLDRNGNGTIDSGRELFGIDTRKRNGQLATDGFDALRDQDLNSDGRISSTDAVFQSLRIWRDLNQDGISQLNELSTLSGNNIVSISVSAQNVNTDLGNGNRQTHRGTFIRTNGTSGNAGETVSTTANLDLLNDTFYREFTEKVLISSAASKLPTIEGSGQVRDLNEAVSQSSQLQSLLQTYAGQTTRTAQVALLDRLIGAWADTSDMKSLRGQARALASSGVSVSYNLANLAAGTPAYEAFLNKLGVVERFMGFTYGGSQGQALTMPLTAGSGQLTVSLQAAQIENISLAYDRLKQNAYGSLLLQTRLRPYLDTVGLLIKSDNAVDLDFSQLEAAFNTAIRNSASKGTVDLMEFVGLLGPVRLQQLGWNASKYLVTQIGPTMAVASYSEMFGSGGLVVAASGQASIQGTSNQDILLGSTGDESITGAEGSDLLFGRAGNDTLNGGTDADIYGFTRGSGSDLIIDIESDGGDANADTLVFAGLKQSDITGLERSGVDLIVRFGVTDRVTVQNHFESSGAFAVESFEFADGSRLDFTDVANRVSTFGDVEGNFLQGEVSYNNRLYGLGGDDTLQGGAMADLLDGGEGNDTLYAGEGADSLQGGAGDDYLYDDAGADTLEGGAGNDTIYGGLGNDTYRFSAGAGIDQIEDYDSTKGNVDTVLFTNVASTQVTALDRVGNNLVLRYGTGDQLTVSEYFNLQYPEYKVERFQFSNNVVWDESAVIARLITSTSTAAENLQGLANTTNRLYGLGGDDTLQGGAMADLLDGGAGNDDLRALGGNDTLQGGAGNDTLYAGEGADSLQGGAGDDYLDGDVGADTLEGGVGNDTIYGGLGNDTYRFSAGGGIDQIVDVDSTKGNIDVIQFTSGAAANQLWLRRTGQDLEISIIGRADKLAVTDWYQSPSCRIEQIRSSDGKMLLNSQVDALVSAMAAFSPPSAGQTSLPANYQSALNTVLAANWKTAA